MSNHRLVPYTNAHRYRQVPTPARMAAMSAARAALGSASPTPQGIAAAFGNTFPFGNLNPGPSLGSDAVNAFLNAAGFGDVGKVLQQLKSGFNEQGPTGRGFVNLAGAGTEPGAMLAQSGAGRMVAQQIAAQHGLHLGGPSSWFEPGGRLYGLPTATQLAGDWALRKDLADAAKYLGTAAAAALGAPLYPPFGSMATGTTAYFLLNAEENYFLKRHKAAVHHGGTHKYPVAPGGPVSPSPNMGYLPAGGAVAQSGGLGMMSNVMRAALVEAIKRMGQQAHEPGSGSGDGGGGTSMAPESMVLHGMRHPYDWVAGMRPVG